MRWIALLLFLPLGLCGCSKVLPTPGKVVEDFLRYADQGDYSTAAGLFTERAQTKAAAAGGLEASFKSMIPKGTLAEVKISNEEINGPTAKVTVQWSVKAGSKGGGGGVFNLVKSGLSWKIDAP